MGKIVPIEEVRFIFNPAVLEKGDILLMNTYEERFREKLGCKFEHAAIYVGDAYIMEANGLHVVMSHIYSYAFREEDHACVLRLKKYSLRTLEEVARNARKQMGRDYVDTNQFRYVRALKNSDKKDTSNNSFCSRLVAQSYADENIHLLPNPDFCEPDDFLTSSLLEEVGGAIIPYTSDMEKIIVNNQKERELHEAESPNSEMFDALSAIYGEDIQDLGQALMADCKHPDKSDLAIDAVIASPMFKHKDDVDREMPWFWDDDSFLEYHSDDKRALHFIYSNLNHYDRTFIPDFRELHAQMVTLAYFRPDCKLAVFLRDYIAKMVNEAIECRIRLEKMYEMMQEKRPESFEKFISEYGPYEDYKYVPKPLDISFILNDVMKALYK